MARRKKYWVLVVIAVMLPPIGCCGIPTYACHVEGDAVTKVPLQSIDKFMDKDTYSLDDIMHKTEDIVDDEILPLTGDAEFTYLRLTLVCVNQKCKVSTMEAMVEVFSSCIPLLVPNYHKPTNRNRTVFTFDFEKEVVEADTTSSEASSADYGSSKYYPTNLEEIVRFAVDALKQYHIDLRNAEFYITIYDDWVNVEPEYSIDNLLEIGIDPTTGEARATFQERTSW